MTRGEIEIEVISELTGDPKPRVREVIDLMKKAIPGLAHDIIDEQISPQEADRLREELKKDDGLITWYKKGLHYRVLLNQ